METLALLFAKHQQMEGKRTRPARKEINIQMQRGDSWKMEGNIAEHAPAGKRIGGQAFEGRRQ